MAEDCLKPLEERLGNSPAIIEKKIKAKKKIKTEKGTLKLKLYLFAILILEYKIFYFQIVYSVYVFEYPKLNVINIIF